jgi:hypothetical protein
MTPEGVVFDPPVKNGYGSDPRAAEGTTETSTTATAARTN